MSERGERKGPRFSRKQSGSNSPDTPETPVEEPRGSVPDTAEVPVEELRGSVPNEPDWRLHLNLALEEARLACSPGSRQPDARPLQFQMAAADFEGAPSTAFNQSDLVEVVGSDSRSDTGSVEILEDNSSSPVPNTNHMGGVLAPALLPILCSPSPSLGPTQLGYTNEDLSQLRRMNLGYFADPALIQDPSLSADCPTSAGVGSSRLVDASWNPSAFGHTDTLEDSQFDHQFACHGEGAVEDLPEMEGREPSDAAPVLTDSQAIV